MDVLNKVKPMLKLNTKRSNQAATNLLLHQSVPMMTGIVKSANLLGRSIEEKNAKTRAQAQEIQKRISCMLLIIGLLSGVALFFLSIYLGKKVRPRPRKSPH
jgi:hypothetical protein